MLQVAFAGTFPASLAQPVRRHLTTPCEIVVADETRIFAEIVDEEALYDALSQRSIAGAALDVWYRYPREPGHAAPAMCPFHELRNVLMTPHVAGWTEGTLEARARLITENIRRAACHEAPLNLVC
jgi:phosphoglycerate dehydrogenase-like enzyme